MVCLFFHRLGKGYFLKYSSFGCRFVLVFDCAACLLREFKCLCRLVKVKSYDTKRMNRLDPVLLSAQTTVKWGETIYQRSTGWSSVSIHTDPYLPLPNLLVSRLGPRLGEFCCHHVVTWIINTRYVYGYITLLTRSLNVSVTAQVALLALTRSI